MNKIKFAALCVLTVLASGCGKGEQTVSTPAGDVKVTQKGTTTTVEMRDAGNKVNITAGEKGVALPDKFPSDIPIMPGAIVKMAISTGEGLSVHFSVAASQADALKYYEENLKARGWAIEATMNMGESAMLSAKKGERECVMTVVKEGGGSVVQVIAPREKS